MDHKWFIQRCLIAIFWLITNFICGITGRPGATGNPRTPRAEGNVISEVCKSFLGLLSCSGLSCTGAPLLMWKNVLFFLVVVARMRKKTIHLCRKQQKQFPCPLLCDRRSDYDCLFVVKSLMWKFQHAWGWEGAFGGFMVSNCSPSSPRRFLFWLQKCLRLYLFYSFFPPVTQKKVVFLGLAIIAECSAPEP